MGCRQKHHHWPIAKGYSKELSPGCPRLRGEGRPGKKLNFERNLELHLERDFDLNFRA
jgi:hypothetical protein